MGSPERCDRVRAAISNSGFALPTGKLCAVMPLGAHSSLAFDLALALCVLLSDRANDHLQRDGWIAWGALHLDGALAPVDEPVVNDLGPGPFIGRVWDPTDHVPAPHEDAVVSVISIDNLEQAWDVLVGLVRIEEMFKEGVGAERN